MRTVEKIIQEHGGLDALKAKYIRIDNPPYMRLVIEYTGHYLVKPRLQRELKAFSKDWDKTIKEQGFLEVYKAILVAS